MSGQYWPEGDEVYHAELTVPVLLVHGMHDKFVPVEEDQRMAEVGLVSKRAAARLLGQARCPMWHGGHLPSALGKPRKQGVTTAAPPRCCSAQQLVSRGVRP